MSLIGLFRDWIIDPIGLIFLLSLVILALLALKRFTLWWLLGACIWLGAMFFISAPRLVNPMLLHYENQFQEQPSCLAARPIVLLGGGVDSRVQDVSQVHYMKHSTFVRTTTAAKLASEYPDQPILVAGGALRLVSEAAVMGYYLSTIGLADERIFEEDQSLNTFENARNIRSLVDQHELDMHINLVTSALHMKRAKAVFERQGFTVCAVAADRHGIENVPNFAWWPQTTALQKFDLLMHEQIALLLYKFRGQL